MMFSTLSVQRGYITRAPAELQSVESESVKRRQSVQFVSDSNDVSGCVKIRYHETSNEDREDFMCAVVTVIFGVCRLAIVL
jgi:hypothetical protein